MIGTIAIRKIDDGKRIVELKRMFVLPEFQGNGYGRLLLEHAVKSAQEQKYQKMCLDTRKQFSVAQHLYRSVTKVFCERKESSQCTNQSTKSKVV